MIQSFEREPGLRHLEVDVVLVAEDKAGPYALLNDTVLYPEGGGQPADHGYLGGIRVHDVQLGAPFRPHAATHGTAPNHCNRFQ